MQLAALLMRRGTVEQGHASTAVRLRPAPPCSSFLVHSILLGNFAIQLAAVVVPNRLQLFCAPCRFRRGIDAKAQLLADIKAVIRQSDASGSDGASAFELSLKSHRANQVRGGGRCNRRHVTPISWRSVTSSLRCDQQATAKPMRRQAATLVYQLVLVAVSMLMLLSRRCCAAGWSRAE